MISGGLLIVDVIHPYTDTIAAKPALRGDEGAKADADRNGRMLCKG